MNQKKIKWKKNCTLILNYNIISSKNVNFEINKKTDQQYNKTTKPQLCIVGQFDCCVLFSSSSTLLDSMCFKLSKCNKFARSITFICIKYYNTFFYYNVLKKIIILLFYNTFIVILMK